MYFNRYNMFLNHGDYVMGGINKDEGELKKEEICLIQTFRKLKPEARLIVLAKAHSVLNTGERTLIQDSGQTNPVSVPLSHSPAG
jgi:hypothetical protein